MQAIFQLFGFEPADGIDEQRLFSRLEMILDAGCKTLIMGPTKDARLTRRVLEKAHRAGARVFLWSPLFAEYEDGAAFEPMICANGAPLPRVFGSAFHFRCPNSEQNLDAFFARQDALMRLAPFDGVFLDRVRYPSFAHGTLGALGCFCPACVRKYQENGVDVPALRRALTAPHGENPLTISGFDGSDLTFDDPNLSAFFALRAQFITQAVAKVRARYGAVGLDLFPPSLAYLVGQSFKALLPLSDFVKPMLYRVTTAPAGLPFERAAYEQAVGSLSILDNLLCAQDEPTRARKEVAAYEHVRAQLALKTPLAWGVEINRIPQIVSATPATISDTLAMLKQSGATAACASWSALTAPDENMSAWLSACP